jgi:integrase
MTKRIPKELKFGSLTFAVWTMGDGRFAFAYYNPGRVVVRRTSFDDLRAEAERVATSLLNAETEALDVTAHDRRVFIAAREVLAPLGLHVDAVARDAAEALTISGTASLRELALFFKRHRRAEIAPKTVDEVIASLIGEISEQDLSGRYKRDMRNDLKRFGAAHGARAIAEVGSDEILDWLRAEQEAGGFAWKRRNHLLSRVVTLFNHARDREWLPYDRKTSAEVVKRLKPPRRIGEISTITAAQMSAWIENIAPRYLPWLLVCGFSGLRSEEVAPDPASNKRALRWEDFRWAKRYINVSRETAKVRDEPRHVPISEQLFAWLEPWHNASGPVCPGEQPSKRETGRLGKITGADVGGRWIKLRWKTNALRHTYISALLGLRDAAGQPVNSRSYVAEICGTSEAKIRAHYREPLEAHEAAAWLSLVPKRPANVLQPRLFA